MGTRADFYIKQESQLQWLGSIAWDGYPMGIDQSILESTTDEQYQSTLQTFLSQRNDHTRPEQGYPWPWKDSNTTDYAYIFMDGKVMCSHFGSGLYDPLELDAEPDADLPEGFFPDMTEIQKVDFGDRSGIIIISSK